ncbi:YybS family protein [Halobacillus sp. A1]|uniref:YybS family protein n=1 Tax=Halobacillus sp. A1 TaxID=2880262 RepID=UPI0020A6DAF2|nr:YybS family protein [Halobacillus sp. A1]MCP3032172.1 YybS family protein [Halobacillus sp. A1]
MNDTRKITEGALMTGAYLLLLLIILFTPGFIGSFFLFVLPIPFIFYSYRHGWKSGILVFTGSLIFTLLFATVFSLPITLLAGIGGLFVGGAMHKKRDPYETWAQGSIGFIIGIVSVYLITQLFMGLNWAEEIRNASQEAFSMTEGLLGSFGGGETSEEQLASLEEQVQALPDYIPSILAMMGIAFAFISQWLSYKIINRVEGKKFYFTPFRNFNLPTSVLWYYFFAMIFTFVFAESDNIWYLAAINVYTLTGTFLVLQGFAFIFYYTHVKEKSKALPILAIAGSLLLPTILMYLVRILGIIDLGFSLRKRLETKK